MWVFLYKTDMDSIKNIFKIWLIVEDFVKTHDENHDETIMSS